MYLEVVVIIKIKLTWFLFRNTKRSTSQTQPVVTIITQPMLLVPIQSKEPVKISRHIQPKPVSQQTESSRSRSEAISQNKIEARHVNLLSSVRQDALIQTDIYGIDTLSVNRNTAPADKTLYSKNTSNLSENTFHTSRQQINYTVPVHLDSHDGLEGIHSVFSQKKSPPKKHTLMKRRCSQKDLNPSSPRWKKMKSSTGIQTSVSLTKKKGVPMVNSTQTTGDYIIETALKHANINIEKKTVGSQVTPQKPCRFDIHLGQVAKPKPVLVDSFSQVKQQNIRAETSHNLAESQTMTDLPPSISTQTLQSYLVNLQERHGKNHSNLSTTFSPNKLTVNCTESVLMEKDTIGTGLMHPAVDKQERKTKDTIVQIYGENLDTSVNYVMPHETRLEQKTKTNIEDYSQKADRFPMYTAVALDGVNVNLLSHNDHIQAQFNAEQTSCRNSTSDPKVGEFAVNKPHNVSSTSVTEETYFAEQIHMTDMEAQTMSASEFDALLQSSGIFINNTEFLFNENENKNVATRVQETGTDTGELVSELDFLGPNTSTIDTQTVDHLSLFESFVPIDSNTQTGGEGLDFFDIMMTNMETQTLNDDDLASLGLLDGALTSNTLENLPNQNIIDTSVKKNVAGGEVGVSVGCGNYEIFKESQTLGCEKGIVNTVFSKNSTVAASASPCFTEENLMKKENTNSQSDVECEVAREVMIPNILSGKSDGTVKVQTETQTVSQDVIEPLLQTETQTQVESTDTDFETINMETQTTFEDLQQLCDWLQ